MAKTGAEIKIISSNEQEQQQLPGNRIYLVTDGLRSKYTKANYRLAFNQFLRDGAKTTDLRVLLDYKPKVIEEMVIGYIESLTDKGKAHKTIQLHVAAILRFFVTLNDIPLNKKKITRFIPPDESSYRNRPYTMEEVRAILDSCPDERTKVIIELMLSTAVRIGAIPGLRICDLTPVSIAGYDLYKIDVYASSRKDTYPTFCTPACRKAIESYLDYRRRLGENIPPLPSSTSKSPLVRELFNVKKPYFIEAPKPATERILQLAIEKALLIAGVNQRMPGLLKGKRREIAVSHGLRKLAITTMVTAGVKDTHRRYLTGHAQVGQDASYVLPTEQDLLVEYVKAIPLLTINQSQRLQQENHDLKFTQAQEIANLKARVQQQDEWLNKYHKYREGSAELLENMKSVLEENGLWPKKTAKPEAKPTD